MTLDNQSGSQISSSNELCGVYPAGPFPSLPAQLPAFALNRPWWFSQSSLQSVQDPVLGHSLVDRLPNDIYIPLRHLSPLEDLTRCPDLFRRSSSISSFQSYNWKITLSIPRRRHHMPTLLATCRPDPWNSPVCLCLTSCSLIRADPPLYANSKSFFSSR